MEESSYMALMKRRLVGYDKISCSLDKDIWEECSIVSIEDKGIYVQRKDKSLSLLPLIDNKIHVVDEHVDQLSKSQGLLDEPFDKRRRRIWCNQQIRKRENDNYKKQRYRKKKQDF